MYLITFLCLNVVAVLVYRIFVIFPQEERMVPPRGHRDRVSHRHSGQFLSHAWRHVLLSSNLPRYDVIIGGKFTSVCNDVVIHKDCTCSLQWCCFSRQSSWTINLGFTTILRSFVGFEYISNCILFWEMHWSTNKSRHLFLYIQRLTRNYNTQFWFPGKRDIGHCAMVWDWNCPPGCTMVTDCHDRCGAPGEYCCWCTSPAPHRK